MALRRTVGKTLLLQTFHNTGINRYPEIFDFIQRECPTPSRILSFGCASGEELLTLESRFPNADLFGVDLSADILAKAAQLVPSASLARNVSNFSGEFHVVFAMAVLCRWPEPHPDGRLPYEDFESTVRLLADRVAVGGHLVIANASYNAGGILEALHFVPIGRNLPAGFVTMRERDGSDSTEKHCVWVRKE